MSSSNRVIEDGEVILMILRRIQVSGSKVVLAFKTERADFTVVTAESSRLLLGMDRKTYDGWKLAPGEKSTIHLSDRGFKYEAVTVCVGPDQVEGATVCRLEMPRSLRRSDSHRLVDFAPDSPSEITLSNGRNSLMEGQVTAFGREGLELTLKDKKQISQFRVGEESTLDFNLDEGLRMVAPARVAYLDDQVVGLQFSGKVDEALMGRYKNWLDGQERLQMQKDRENLDSGKKPVVRVGAALPAPYLLVDRDPMILLITESEEFSQRMAEAFGRKYGFLRLDYIKGMVKGAVKEHVGPNDWGRIKMILVHNRLRLASPLELTKQLVIVEKCPLPVICIGPEEDADLRRNRTMAAGAVDYIVVEPFRILSVLKKLDEILQMFN